MMNTEADKHNIRDMEQLISRTHEGGFMIVRCKLDNDAGGTDQMDIALEKARNAIGLYPSKVVPII